MSNPSERTAKVIHCRCICGYGAADRVTPWLSTARLHRPIICELGSSRLHGEAFRRRGTAKRCCLGPRRRRSWSSRRRLGVDAPRAVAHHPGLLWTGGRHASARPERPPQPGGESIPSPVTWPGRCRPFRRANLVDRLQRRCRHTARHRSISGGSRASGWRRLGGRDFSIPRSRHTGPYPPPGGLTAIRRCARCLSKSVVDRRRRLAGVLSPGRRRRATVQVPNSVDASTRRRMI